MESQQRSQSAPPPDPGMCGCDRDIFLRVWQRVMPEETPDCPISVDRQEEVPAQAATPEQAPPVSDGAEDDFPSREDVPCLGSGAQADLERLQDLTAQELACWRAYQILARRVPGQGSRTLASLAGGCRRRAKRLSAALFLVSGVRYWPTAQAAVSPPRSYFGALREHFLSEQNRGCSYRAAAEDCRDACLRALYLDLADECAEHACRIRSLLENM